MDELRTTPPQAIPVANLWWLLLYASDLLRHVGRRRVALSQESLQEHDSAAIPDLLTRHFLTALRAHLRRGLLQESQPTHATLSRVRGRIDLLATLTHQQLQQGKVSCHFSAWQTHTAFYQVLLAALVYVLPLLKEKMLIKHCQESKHLLQSLVSKSLTPFKPLESEQARHLHLELPPQIDDTPRFLYATACLILSLALPSEAAGKYYFLQLSHELPWLRRLYEKAIGGFYRLHAPVSGWQVKTGLPLQWQTSNPSPDIATLLPGMRTDIVLEHPATTRRIIIETKFTEILHSSGFRSDSIKSVHLYQLYAYVMSQHNPADPYSVNSQGILLHPTFSHEVDAYVTIQNHPLHFKTLNLTAPAATWQQTLLGLLA